MITIGKYSATDILDDKIKKAVINKGFDPDDGEYLKNNGFVSTGRVLSTLFIDKLPICSWVAPVYWSGLTEQSIKESFREL